MYLKSIKKDLKLYILFVQQWYMIITTYLHYTQDVKATSVQFIASFKINIQYLGIEIFILKIR